VPGEGRSVLVVGATSDIGHAIARAFADQGYAVQLAGRDPVRLKAVADDLGESAAGTHPCDVLAEGGGTDVIDELDPLPDVAVCAVGAYGRAQGGEEALRLMRVNYMGPALLLGALGERFAARGSGVLVGISSVSGDRGRGRNLAYGSAKAAFTAYLSGLRNRLFANGVHVVTVKPGYVRTRGAAPGKPRVLTAEPEEVGRAVLRAVHRRLDVVYVRRRWRLVMLAVRATPERWFKRLGI